MSDFSQFGKVNIELDFLEPLQDSCFVHVQVVLGQS